mgnify:CR=1 FL=1
MQHRREGGVFLRGSAKLPFLKTFTEVEDVALPSAVPKIYCLFISMSVCCSLCTVRWDGDPL